MKTGERRKKGGWRSRGPPKFEVTFCWRRTHRNSRRGARRSKPKRKASQTICHHPPPKLPVPKPRRDTRPRAVSHPRISRSIQDDEGDSSEEHLAVLPTGEKKERLKTKGGSSDQGRDEEEGAPFYLLVSPPHLSSTRIFFPKRDPLRMFLCHRAKKIGDRGGPQSANCE